METDEWYTLDKSTARFCPSRTTESASPNDAARLRRAFRLKPPGRGAQRRLHPDDNMGFADPAWPGGVKKGFCG
jgi:hypothetical protein